MLKKIILVVLVLFIGLSALAQNSINDYKYVVVPLQFDFLKGKDKYRTSTLTRHLFKKEGFEVFFDEEELPEELFKDRCLALYADVIKTSKIFKNTVQIELKDCYGNLVFLSQEGSTKIKEYKDAFPVAIKEAFKSIEALNYTYNPNSKVASNTYTVGKKDNLQKDKEAVDKAEAEVKRLKKEVEDLKKEKEIVNKATKSVTKKDSLTEGVKANSELELKQQDQETNLVKAESNLLKAKPNAKGFEIVDASNRLKMILLKTAAPNVYTVKGKEAIVFKEGDKWYYSENNTKSELRIKF